MRRILLVLSIVGLAALMLAGCGGGGSSDGNNGNDTPVTTPYLPLHVGNVWTYDYYQYMNVQAMRPGTPGRALPRPGEMTTADVAPVELTTEVQSTSTIAGASWYELTSSVGNGSRTYYFRHNMTGLARLDDPAAALYYTIKAPISIGTTWDVPWVDDNDKPQTDTYTIVGLHQTVGAYNECMVIQSVWNQAVGMPADIITAWYARDVGLVCEQRTRGSDLVYLQQLKQFTPASGG